jgi:hypothetical protein
MSALAKQLESDQFPPACAVGAESDFGGRIDVIISRKVKAAYRHPDGCGTALTILGASEIFGAIALSDPGSREMSVTTLAERLAVPIEPCCV